MHPPSHTEVDWVACVKAAPQKHCTVRAQTAYFARQEAAKRLHVEPQRLHLGVVAEGEALVDARPRVIAEASALLEQAGVPGRVGAGAASGGKS